MSVPELLKLEYSYLSLPDKFYSLEKLNAYQKPALVLLNIKLLSELEIPIENEADLLSFLTQNATDKAKKPFAQAYAGHQFGHFNMLGDGRAVVLGEYLHADKRYDIQLKGSGRTAYSRNGDGKATLKAMLREYLMSEAMYHLGIPTSRSLFVAKTGEMVHRERINQGAVLGRLMQSHLRVGTFQFAAAFGTAEDLKALADYTINRLFPEVKEAENPILALLEKVIQLQIDLVTNWMRVGFIHGVMNSDNVSISGETFDFGPCAFINAYHPETVFSSIDRNGRYSFGNQQKITKWNIARFAETLLPILHTDEKIALQLAQTAIDKIDSMMQKQYYQMMLRKIGIESDTAQFYDLIDDLLRLMQELQMDYTNTFWRLSREITPEDHQHYNAAFQAWLLRWDDIINDLGPKQNALDLMKKQNPVLIPRNHQVEEALEEAADGDFSYFKKLTETLAQPYVYRKALDQFMQPPSQDFEAQYQTFCGT